jgi:hypothetical protein
MSKEMNVKSAKFNAKPIIAESPLKKMTRDQLKAHVKSLRDKDNELVTGVFQNLENRATGGSKGALVFSYKAYAGDPYEFYELHDGERYQLPRGVVRHLNTNCFYREYHHLNNAALGGNNVAGDTPLRVGVASDGRLQKQQYQASRKVHRFAFHNLEYMEDDGDMAQTNLIEVTTTP